MLGRTCGELRGVRGRIPPKIRTVSTASNPYREEKPPPMHGDEGPGDFKKKDREANQK